MKWEDTGRISCVWQHHIAGLRIRCSGGRIDARRLPLRNEERRDNCELVQSSCNRWTKRYLNNGYNWEVNWQNLLMQWMDAVKQRKKMTTSRF